ncbi:MAG: VOC family protein [Labilithrix sp.]|nr:VOC family protein [Labilithrix sp.]MCW5816478.1 VOC family protein [Labilithrix sp.]
MSIVDHFGVTVTDFEKGLAFYEKALAPLGIKVVMKIGKELTGGQYEGAGFGNEKGKPDFWIGAGGGKKPAGNACHFAFVAASRAEVDAFYKAALDAGGKDNGPPGVRAHYHPAYYGAFVLDLDGHNIEAVTHKPE